MKKLIVILVLSIVGITTVILVKNTKSGSGMDSGLSIRKTGDVQIDDEALVLGEDLYGVMRFSASINGNSFQQDALLTHKGYQYIGYYDHERQVCIARRELPEGDWEIIRFKDYIFKVNDAHNTISLGICPNDGTIHVSFDQHAKGLNYRFSKKGVASNPHSVEWDTALFSDIQSHLSGTEVPSITYPRFLQTPDGELQLFWRRNGSGNGDRMLADYDSKTGRWNNIRQIDSRKGIYGDSDSRCSYPNGYNYGPKGRLHVTWVWRERARQGSNHDLMYAYSEDNGNNWKNSDGDPLEGVPAIDSPGITVVKIPDDLGLMNTHGQAVDSQGRIHAIMWHCTEASIAAAGARPGEFRWGPPKARRYHHYWRDEAGMWHHVELPGISGNRPKVFIDKRDNVYLIFGKNPPDAQLERDVYFAQEDLVIMAATAGKQWQDWRIIHTEKGPFMNEMLYDYYRWQNEGVLSVIVQESASRNPYASALRLIDFELKN